MDKIKNYIPLAALALAIIAIALIILKPAQGSVVFVDSNKLTEEFSMTKELEGKYEGVNTKRKELLDSLELQVGVLEKKIQAGDNSLLQQYKSSVIDYQSVYKQFEESNQKISEEFSNQVIKQLNEYIKEYGKKNKIDYILGANGSGSILYASDKKDITDEVIKYVNQRYKGGI